VPGIHVFFFDQGVDGRDKPGHDGVGFGSARVFSTSKSQYPRYWLWMESGTALIPRRKSQPTDACSLPVVRGESAWI
jgi:hypothetical protein